MYVHNVCLASGGQCYMAVDVWSSNLKVVISAHTSKSVYLSRTGRRTEFAGWAVMVEALPLRAAVPLTNQPTTHHQPTIPPNLPTRTHHWGTTECGDPRHCAGRIPVGQGQGSLVVSRPPRTTCMRPGRENFRCN